MHAFGRGSTETEKEFWEMQTSSHHVWWYDKKQGQCWEKRCDFTSMTNIGNWMHIWYPCFQHTDADLGRIEKTAAESRLKMYS